MKVTRSDGNQLTPEERRNNVVVMVTQRNYTEYWNRWDGRNQEIGAVQIVNHTVPPNGIFKIEFPILDDSSELQLKVPSVSHHYVTAATLKLSSCGRHSTCWEVTLVHGKWTHFYFKRMGERVKK